MPSQMLSRLAALAALALLCAPAQARRVYESANEFIYEAEIGAGLAIEIKGVNGNVTAEESDGAEVEVVARKRGDKSDPAEVRLTVVEHNNGATICALYPNEDMDRPNHCGAGDDGQLTSVPSDVQVDFVVRVPRGVRFVGRTANGKVAAKAVTGGVEAHTVNGSIDIQAAGPAKASSVNGSIKATIAPGLRQRTELNTINGDLTVAFAANGLSILAETVNGGIDARVPFTNKVESTPTRLLALFDSASDPASPELRLRTVNGDIRIERAQ